MDTDKNIYVYYSGGAGGVMLQMSLLLLLRDTHKNYDCDITDVINNVWDIPTVDKWKETEPFEGFFTGENTCQEIKAVTGNHLNIFRVCGAPKIIHSKDDISISIYTDIETQFTLAKLKNAHWFRPGYHGDGGYVSNGVELYNAIKEDFWPEITSINDLPHLSDHIKNELINERGYPTELDNPNKRIMTQLAFLKTEKYNGYDVYDLAVTINKECDHVFLLQDVINTEFQCVADALGLENTQEVKDHINQWVSLHPENIQKMLKRG